MAIEYIYWAQASHMGVLDDLRRVRVSTMNGSRTPALLQERDVLIHALVTDPAQLPQLAPNVGRTRSNRGKLREKSGTSGVPGVWA